ncbi:bZIP transcription factor 29-like [Oryza brachyantha]|nr:bZIP transcription factor 29-like [Oryza brachyantha]
MNGGIGDALMQVQVQAPPPGMSLAPALPMVAATFVGAEPASKPRAAGLPPTPPQQVFAGQRPAAAGGDVCMEDSVAQGAGLPPRKAHRRSSSDVSFGYLGGQHHLLPPPKVEAGWAHLGGGAVAADDLFTAYMNLEGLDGLNSSDDRGHDEGDSRGSSFKTNGADSSENESEECADDTRGGIRLWADGTERREGVKRNATGEPAAVPLARHARSLSMDSLIGKFNFTATAAAAAANGAGLGPNRFSLEFGSGEFTTVEMKKIMADEKLAEMALADPKRVKRVLANRQSAARSKERKMRYIAELEQKVQILQSEATKLSTQVTILQRDSAGLATQNNELKFRLQAMEQQAHLRDALNEALTTEVQRLKLATAELGDTCSSSGLVQQIQLNTQNQMFQLQQPQQAIPFYQLQQTQQNGAAKNNEANE